MAIMQYKQGDRILGRWEGGPFWFAGTVHSFAGDSVAIQYDDGTSEIRPVDDVRPLDWAVGSRLEAVWSGNGGWYDANIMDVSPDGTAFDVRFDDGIRERVSSGHCRVRG